MSGSKINDYSIGDENIQSVMLTLDKAYKGLHQVSLTNYDNTSASQIAAGSVVENNGALYQFLSNESITGSPSDGTVYIRLVPSGDTITAEYTTTAPTWSDSKQGWYGTGGDANKRYIEFKLKKSGPLWSEKDSIYFDSWTYTDPIYGLLPDGTPLYAKTLTFSWGNDASSAEVSHGISNAATDKKILSVLPIRRAVSNLVNENLVATLVSWTDTIMKVSRDINAARTYDVFIIYKK